jgi:hypothetical protein
MRLPLEVERDLGLKPTVMLGSELFYETPFEAIYLGQHQTETHTWVLFTDREGCEGSVNIHEYLLIAEPEIVKQVFKEFNDEIPVNSRQIPGKTRRQSL